VEFIGGYNQGVLEDLSPAIIPLTAQLPAEAISAAEQSDSAVEAITNMLRHLPYGSLLEVEADIEKIRCLNQYNMD